MIAVYKRGSDIVYEPIRTREVRVVTYADNREYRCHSQEMIEDGWRPLTSIVEDGHVHWGRTLLKVILTGGLGLLFGGPSRSPTLIHVTWERIGDAGSVHSRSVLSQERAHG